MQRLAQSVLLLVAVLSAGGCGAAVGANLFVDNDGDRAIRVQIDDGKLRYVGPGNQKNFHVPYGEHRIRVTRGDSVIVNETKVFEPHVNGPNWRHYLLDPDADTRYAVYEYYYYATQEEANSKRLRRPVGGLPRKRWVDVPQGACALVPMQMVFASSSERVTKRRCVCPVPRED